MAIGPIHCGTFLLLAATALLLVATISAPVIKSIGFLNIHSGTDTTSLGVFGYCIRPDSGTDQCTGSHVGYDITAVTGTITSSTWVNSHLEGLTKALILQPIACGLAFFAFIVALLSSKLGFLLASFLALLAFIVSLAAMAVDFALFTIVRNHINDNSTTATASFSTAIWLVLAATVVLFFSVFIVCFSCVTGRRHSRDNYGSTSRGVAGGQGYYGNGGYTGDEPVMAQPVGKRHFWSRNKAVY